MTNEQFDEIKELLKLYRKRNGTTIKKCKEEFSKHFYDAFLDYQENLDRYSHSAFLSQDPPQYYIDSLCFLAVVAINAGYTNTVFCCDSSFYAVSTSVRRIFDEMAKRGLNPHECMKKFIKEKTC